MKIIFIFVLFLFLTNTSKSYIYSKNNRLYDHDGLERIFHGVNVVYKGYPWLPNIHNFSFDKSFTIKDTHLLKNWGFNVIRLGVMWPGLEPVKNIYSTEYLKNLEYIVKICNDSDIYVILDFHQDLLSNRFCGEGVPDWIQFSTNNTHKFPYPIDHNYHFNNTVPYIYDCQKHYWVEYQFTEAVSRAYQDLYDNYDDFKIKFIDFWKKIASVFKNYSNIVGYELINEPWAGDIFKHPSLLYPGIADRENLQSLYDDIVNGIREYDNYTAVLFESVTWDINGVGFNKTPLNQQNHSILSYHAYFPPNINIEYLFKTRIKDLNRLNIGGFLTEFDYGSGDNLSDKSLKKALDIINHADKFIQSWTIWDYKMFFSLTGSNKGFFNKDESLTNTYYTMSRPYPIYVEGSIEKIYFNNSTGVFNLVYKPNYNIDKNSKVYINYNIHYPNNYTVNIIPLYAVSYKTIDNYILFYLNKSMTVSTINILIKPL